jgi:hypothetical protein
LYEDIKAILLVEVTTTLFYPHLLFENPITNLILSLFHLNFILNERFCFNR